MADLCKGRVQVLATLNSSTYPVIMGINLLASLLAECLAWHRNNTSTIISIIRHAALLHHARQVLGMKVHCSTFVHWCGEPPMVVCIHVVLTESRLRRRPFP